MTPKKSILFALIFGLWAVAGLLFLLSSQAQADTGKRMSPRLANAAQPPGLVHYWNFEEGSGTIAADVVGKNDGTVMGGATWIDGPVGKALYFDGVDDQIYIPQNFPTVLPLHKTGDFSLLFWIKREDTVHRTIFWTRNDTIDQDRFHINLMSDGSGNLGVDYRAPDGTLHGDLFGGATIYLPENQWAHIAIVRSGNTYTIYQNGQLIGQGVDSNPDLPTYEGGWYIAKRATNPPVHNNFWGGLDEIAIFNTALTAEQVQTYYQNGLNGQGYGVLDDFNDNTLNPALWMAQITGSGPTALETRQRLEITLPAGSQGGGGAIAGSVNSICKIQGDFDMVVKYKLLAWPQDNGVHVGMKVFASGMADKTVERVSGSSTQPPVGEYYTATFRSGATLSSTTHTSGTLRLVRNGDTFFAYYQAPATGQWMQVASQSGQPTGNVYFGLSTWSNDTSFAGQNVQVSLDDFALYTGRTLCMQGSTGKSAIASPAGVPIVYTHTLTNIGNYTDTYSLSHSSTQGWPTTHEQTITLKAGASYTFTVSIVPPVGAISGTIETTTITITSQTDADIFASISDVTTLQTRYLYIPIILKAP